MGRARDCPPLDSTACPTTTMGTQQQQQQRQQQRQQQASTSRPASTSITNAKERTTTEKPFVQLAVVGLLMDSTAQHLLITRRPSYMRSFPGAWVFPGGSVDPHESLSHAIAREIQEETGLVTDENDWTCESVWESVYPTTSTTSTTTTTTTTTTVPQPPDDTIIQAHHVVVYMSSTLSSSSSPQQLQPCPEEVDGAVWLSRQNVDQVLAEMATRREPGTTTTTRTRNDDSPTTTTTMLRVMMHTPNDGGEIMDVLLNELVGIYPQETKENAVCGLAQGSLFALEEFWSKSTNF
jgi:8-oxo-dGTP pyrophosphatase MutT (NUDIX family)